MKLHSAAGASPGFPFGGGGGSGNIRQKITRQNLLKNFLKFFFIKFAQIFKIFSKNFQTVLVKFKKIINFQILLKILKV